jgi:hypothetical protein
MEPPEKGTRILMTTPPTVKREMELIHPEVALIESTR